MNHRLYGRIRSSAYDHPIKDVENAILKAQKGMFQVGITAQKNAAADDAMVQAHRNLHRRGELKIRSFLLYNLLGKTTVQDAQNLVNDYKPEGDDLLTLSGVKCSYDEFHLEYEKILKIH